MKHLGDITKINGSDIACVDCITFGSPCQDLSIAGKRAGLAGARSGLFMEAVRVIKEMRESSGGLYPTFAIWENVPGAFSSNGGEDFRAVLEELAKISQNGISIPRPKNGKWSKAGFICGNEWSIAWRTMDAQFWGVPQRRRRIALVMDFGGQRAGKILFERTGVSRDSEPSIPPWKGIARNTAHCVVSHDRKEQKTKVYGITSYQSNSMKSNNPKSGIYEAKISKTLDLNCGDPSCNQGGIAVCCLLNNQSTASNTRNTVMCRAQSNTNAETYEEKSPTLTASHDGPPILFESHSQDARHTQQKSTSQTCTAGWGTGGNNMPMVAKKLLRWIVRRLTPTECERLQGYPDGWTDIGEWVDSKGKKRNLADGPRYKALGNSIALPQWWWVTYKTSRYLPDQATLGSLFDGIGGFPLVWETLHGKGTAVWASEIEEFPIAVTKYHFGEE